MTGGAALRGEALTIDDGSFCFLRTGRYFWAEEAGENVP